jgi:hypothetical protein
VPELWVAEDGDCRELVQRILNKFSKAIQKFVEKCNESFKAYYLGI